MLLPYEKGIEPISEVYEVTSSDRAVRLLYYLQRIGYFYCNTHYYVKREEMDSFLLLYVIKGKMYVSSHGEQVIVEAGQMSFLDCYQPHEYSADESLEYIFIHIDGANTRAFWEEIWKEYGLLIQTVNASHIQCEMEQMLEQMRTTGQMNEVNTSRRLYDLLCSLLYTSDIDEAKDPQIAIVQRYLYQHLAEDISSNELAREVHLSVSQLNRRFKESTGQSPHEYLVNLRINRAKTLLRESQMSVTEIAGKVGYAYDTSFAAVFRSKVGMSPRQFRNMLI